MRKLRLLAGVVVLNLVHGTSSAEDLVSLSTSDVWQVRYCVAGKFTSATPAARTTLERLAADPNRGVARHAFAYYSRLFADLDEDLSKTAFARGDFDLVGITVKDRRVFETPDFWARDLASDTGATQARAARAIGMCGTAKDIPGLAKQLETENPYLLYELAVALHRLGDHEKCLSALDSLLDLPIEATFHYKNLAIDFLIQTHFKRSRAAWNIVHDQFEKAGDQQPNWVYAHIAQERRLPRKGGEQDAAVQPPARGDLKSE